MPAGPAPRIGWLSSGRDPAARTLLREVAERAARDRLTLHIALVFCDRERGESADSDAFLDLAGDLDLPVAALSSAASWQAFRAGAPETADVDRDAWRAAFHEEALHLLEPHRLDVLVLAGYMLIVSPAMCARHAMLNLHPALPGGPTGSWQQVIWELLRRDASETGAMIHLVTPELDRGPVVSFDRFPIRGGAFDPLWEAFDGKLAAGGLAAIIEEEGEAEPLFALIRSTGEAREIPLLYRTVAQFVRGRLRAAHGHVLSTTPLPMDLTAEVELEDGS